jgi:glycosyltransferase involved in cell wall biosynthesis
MVGRFDYAKGADTLLLAFEKLRRSHPEARLTLVGPKIGIETGAGKIASFEEFARANLSPKTAERIELTGTLNQDAIAHLRREAFVTVVASRSETFSYALVEGLAAGCPMLSTAWPASLEIIRDDHTGLLTPVGDADVMAMRLSWLFENPQTAAQIGENGLRHCARTFTVETVGERLLECYEATLRNSVQ